MTLVMKKAVAGMLAGLVILLVGLALQSASTTVGGAQNGLIKLVVVIGALAVGYALVGLGSAILHPGPVKKDQPDSDKRPTP
jgi:hypothetical protein